MYHAKNGDVSDSY